MMIKTKAAFFIFILLFILLFPYSIIPFISSDSLYSLIPGWHTTIFPVKIISNLFKLLILSITTIFYLKLTKATVQINFKKFLIHFLLTIPAVFIGMVNFYKLTDFNYLNTQSFISHIQFVVFINICANILFFIGQILFGIQYFKIKKLKN